MRNTLLLLVVALLCTGCQATLEAALTDVDTRVQVSDEARGVSVTYTFEPVQEVQRFDPELKRWGQHLSAPFLDAALRQEFLIRGHQARPSHRPLRSSGAQSSGGAQDPVLATVSTRVTRCAVYTGWTQSKGASRHGPSRAQVDFTVSAADRDSGRELWSIQVEAVVARGMDTRQALRICQEVVEALHDAGLQP